MRHSFRGWRDEAAPNHPPSPRFRALGSAAGGALATAADWDVVQLAEHPAGWGSRTDSKTEWVAHAVTHPDLADRAQLDPELLAAWGAHEAVSVRAGTGTFEYLLAAAAPSPRLRCGDFADASVVRLGERLGDLAEVVRMDLHSAKWVRRPDAPVIMIAWKATSPTRVGA